MIKTSNITKAFGDLQVLKGIELEIQDGEVVAIVGPSGAGKTTLLQILGTLSRPNAGSVWYDNDEISQFSNKKMARFRNQNIGFVFQFHHLLPEFNALENVFMPALIAGLSRFKAEEKARELLGFLNLSERLGHKPMELSGGEQQRVAVARALINNPKVVMADEPSGNLDTESKNDLHSLFFTLREKYGQTFIIVTHDMGLAKMSDRTLTIKDGRFTS